MEKSNESLPDSLETETEIMCGRDSLEKGDNIYYRLPEKPNLSKTA